MRFLDDSHCVQCLCLEWLHTGFTAQTVTSRRRRICSNYNQWSANSRSSRCCHCKSFNSFVLRYLFIVFIIYSGLYIFIVYHNKQCWASKMWFSFWHQNFVKYQMTYNKTDLIFFDNQIHFLLIKLLYNKSVTII